MGAFGSCLGIGRPGANPCLLGSNLVNANGHPFGPNSGARKPVLRSGLPRAPTNTFLANGALNGKGPPKLVRQTSSLSGSQQQQLPPYHQNAASSQVLVDFEDNPLPSFEPTAQNSHLICNRKQSTPLNGAAGISAGGLDQNGAGGPASNMLLKSIKMNPKEVKVLIALYDYERITPDDLEFKKGDHLETTVSLMRDEWWLARSKSSGRVGYIPSNYVAELKTLGAEPWYLGKIGRAEAEHRLRSPENADGAFIIRDSDTNDNNYSLSLKHENEVKHYRIRPFEHGGFYINRKTIFSTIHDLVLHYSRAPDGLCVNLREPCASRFEKPATIGLSHDTCDRWEIDRNKLTLLHELGRGQFGQVFEGRFANKTRVAIKTLRKGSMDPQDFLAEAQIMKKMRHENLVQLYAVCTKEEPVYIVTELMSKGALISYLQTDEGKSLPLSEYINMATQIASGMSYIEREKYVHRDLAARNILVGDSRVCKIADFGLARFIKETEYEARAGARFPIKWTAPEAANFSKFTIKSDVWSFGIVLYEIITKGGTPYPDMTNAEVLSRIDKGYRMLQPPNCEAKYYNIMVECWNKEPSKRPTFETLHWKLSDYFTSDEQYREASQYRDR